MDKKVLGEVGHSLWPAEGTSSGLRFGGGTVGGFQRRARPSRTSTTCTAGGWWWSCRGSRRTSRRWSRWSTPPTSPAPASGTPRHPGEKFQLCNLALAHSWVRMRAFKTLIIILMFGAHSLSSIMFVMFGNGFARKFCVKCLWSYSYKRERAQKKIGS